MPRRLAVYQPGRGSAPVVVVRRALPLVAVNMPPLDPAERVQNLARRERHVGERLGTERAQRIVDGVHDRAGRAARAGFARAFGAQLGIGGRRDHVTDVDIRYFGGHRYEIIRYAAVEQLSARVIDAVLVERRADALHHAAANLLVDELWVDHSAAILDAPVLEQRHDPGVGVYFEIARLDAVGESERPGARHVVARRHQFRLEAGRQRVGTEIGDAGELV